MAFVGMAVDVPTADAGCEGASADTRHTHEKSTFTRRVLTTTYRQGIRNL